MSTHDITIDDGSPLITYSGDWSDSANEDITDQYWLNTYHSTSEIGASATFKFTGNAVYLYGSKRPSHGLFDVEIDGASLGQFDGESTAIESTQLLASAKDLNWGEHTITITNSDTTGKFLDLDKITWTTGKAGLKSITNTTVLDDADSSGVVSYSPSGSWSTVDPVATEGNYYQSTVHTTSTVGSAVAVQFTGNAVYVFGSTDSSSGLFDAQVDQNPATSMNGTTSTYRQPALLYYVDGLDSSEHTLTLTNQAAGSVLRFDYLVASTWDDGTSANAGASSSASPTPNANSNAIVLTSNHPATLIGIIVGGVVGLILLILFTLCFLRLRRAATMEDTRSSIFGVTEDAMYPDGQARPRPISSRFSWAPRMGGQNRPMSTVSGVSGTSGPGMAGIGAGIGPHRMSRWGGLKRRSAQQSELADKMYPGNTLMPPSR